MSKNIAIIAALIYPVSSPRANRATELAKELGRLGHNVTLYAAFENYDYSEFEKTHNIKVRSIGTLWFERARSDGNKELRFIDKLVSKLLSNVIDYPKIEFILVTKKLIDGLKNIDLLITIGKPHPIHWGAAFSKKFNSKNTFPKKWIADCGDPYMGNEFHKRPWYFKYLEHFFCKYVDKITIPLIDAKKSYYPQYHSKIIAIPQGFNFDEVKICNSPPKNLVPTFIYAGVFYKDLRDPTLFLEYLSSLQTDFMFIIYTRSVKILAPFQEKLKGKLKIIDYIPRLDLLYEMSKADFVLNVENYSATEVVTTMPSKLIDYTLTQRPILNISSTYIDKENIDKFLKGDYSGKYIPKDIGLYNIKNVAQQFLEL